jgi:hypothetical protein
LLLNLEGAGPGLALPVMAKDATIGAIDSFYKASVAYRLAGDHEKEVDRARGGDRQRGANAYWLI